MGTQEQRAGPEPAVDGVRGRNGTRASSLHASEAPLEPLMDVLPDAVFVTAADGSLRRSNAAGLRLLGLVAADLDAGVDVLERFDDVHDRRVLARALEAAPDGTLRGAALTLRRSDGTHTAVLVTAAVDRSAEGDLLGYQIFARDIADHQRVAAALQRREDACRQDLEHVSDIVFTLDPSGVLLSVSPSVERTLGYAPADLIGKDLPNLRVLTQASLRRALQNLERLRAGDTTPPLTYELTARDGSRVYAEIMTSAVREDGRIARLIAVARNVTDRVLAERKLRASEELNRSTFEQAAVGIVTARPHDHGILEANRRACEILGYTREELRAHTFRTLTHPEDLAASAAAMGALLRGDRPRFQIEKRYVRKDGRIITANLTVSVVRDEAGRPLQTVAVLEDVSARKESERQLARLAAAVEHAAEDIIITDVDGRIVYVNPAFEHITGYASDEVVGLTPRFLRCTPHERGSRSDMLRTLQNGGNWSSRARTRRKNGTLLDQDITVTAIRDARGAKLGHVAVRRDVTEKLKLEAQLRQVQKLEAIGTLAGGIAHDFNNMLAPIIGYADMTLEQLEPDSPLHRYQTRIAQAARRASDLVRQILTFSRQAEQERQPIDLTPLVKELLKLMRASLPSTIRIDTQVGKDLGTVLADPTEMHQVLMNLTANAAHAMREHGGRLELHLDPCDVDADLARSLPGLAPGPHVRITVRDDGCGMDEETLGRVFEPFFTTKAKGEGTGLGLSVVHGIVTSHAGAITVESALGQGTTFRIYLPRHAATAEAVPNAEEPIRGGSERILLVDDERGIAEYGRLALVRLGYKVRALESAREALQTFRGQPEGFDLVLTDLTMPLLTGLDLAREMRAIRPSLPVVLMTGSNDACVQRAVEEGRVSALIEKPAGLRRLASVLRECLDRR